MKIARCFSLAGFVLLALCSLAATARAWDGMGHMLIDEIAWENVRPEVRERVADLVAILGTKYNGHKPYNFVTAGCYLDDIRPLAGYKYGAWHFIDVPYTRDGRGYFEPRGQNAIWALEEAEKTLRNANATGAERAEALAVVLHLVGDLHQPLHCADWNDQGGGGYYIAGIPFSEFSKKQPPSLHAFWDRAYRYGVTNGQVVELFYNLWPAERPGVPAQGIVRNQAARIVSQYPLSGLKELAEQNDPHAWARESYRYACKFGYPPGPHPGDNEMVTLAPIYVERAHDIACRRVALAGYRLAEMLERLFGGRSGG